MIKFFTKLQGASRQVQLFLFLCGIYYVLSAIGAASSGILLGELGRRTHVDFELRPAHFIPPTLINLLIAGFCFASVCLHVKQHHVARGFSLVTLLLILVEQALGVTIQIQIEFSAYSFLEQCLILLVVFRALYLLWRMPSRDLCKTH